jgi:murein DD-endopeptidase MepM/ murein hydrolase activator NlpD
MRLFILFLSCISFVVSAQTDRELAALKEGGYASDTSYVYELPYEKGRSFCVVQGYHSRLSHRGEIALDFKMRKGTPVCAMRDGVVIELKEDSNRGGIGSKFYSSGNYILVRHSDETFAWYFHLQQNGALINVGDVVKAGQIIGLSGSTGYSAFPHLHVEVVTKRSSDYRQLPMRFQSRTGVHYLRPGHFYRNGARGKS